MFIETNSPGFIFRRVLGRALVLGTLILTAESWSQNLPEPPLPILPSRESRAAAAEVQAPKNVRPPPPVPSGVEMSLPTGASPIPPQAPDSAALKPTAGSAAQAPQLPTGFTSKVTTSTSASGQFKVFGKDLQTRSPFSSRCDEIAERLRRLMHDDQPWVLPVVVAIKTAQEVKLSGPAVSTSISQITNGGFHLQVTVQARPHLRPADIDAEITRILIAERILRNQKEITTKRSMVLPEWLLTGITQAMSFRDRSRPSAVFAAIFKSGKIYGIEEILDVAPGQLDALSRTIYETSCCALVLALLDQPEGPASLRRFLSLLAVDSRDDRALLNACFPTLALSTSSLNKWWSLQMASLATPSVFETLGPTETRKALTEALVIHYETTADSAPRKRTVIAGADEPPAEAPPAEDEKKPGLIGRIFGAGSPADADKKTEEAKPADVAKVKADAEAKPDAEVAQEEKKKGILGRMFGASSSAEEPAVEAKEEKKPESEPPAKPEPKKSTKDKDEAKPAPEEGTAETKKPGFLGRMFGGGTAAAASEEPAKETKEEKPKPDPEPKAEVKEKPAKKAETPKPSAEEEPTEPKKRGILGRMFGGGSAAKPEAEPEKKADKKSDSKKPEEESKTEEKKKSAALETPADPMLELREHWIAMGEEWGATATAMWADYTATRGHEVVKLRLPLFGKKKADDPDKPAEEEKPKEEKPAEAPKKKESKPEPEPEKKSEPAPKPKAKPAPVRPRLVPVSIPLEDYASIMKRKDRAAILDGTARALSALSARANVLFRPVINDYLAVLADLKNGKTKDADQRLTALRARTAKAYEQAKAVQDHLDWFEASETKDYSGTFEDYLKLPAQIEKELPVKDDPLSKYLDALDLEFGR